MNNKVGIISLFGMYNFGNRLQGYALDYILKELSFNPETIVLYRKLGVSVSAAWVRSKLEIMSGNVKAAVRNKRFKEFTSGQVITYVWFPWEIAKLKKRYDFFCVGSDQVWNPKADLFPGTKLLQFADPSQRVAVAPSIGVSELPRTCCDEYARELKQYKALSVRENEGASIVEGLTGIKPEVLVDPTLALTKEQWADCADFSKVPDTPFILVYFLGGWSLDINDYLELTSDYESIPVVDLLDVDSSFYCCGPQDFLGLVIKASVVLTDSFHASVFSTIFGTPFRVFERREGQSTYSRIRTLLDNYHLLNVEGYGPIPSVTKEGRGITESLLNKYRSMFIDYVRESLNA